MIQIIINPYIVIYPKLRSKQVNDGHCMTFRDMKRFRMIASVQIRTHIIESVRGKKLAWVELNKVP